MKNDDCTEGGAHGAILWCPSMERWRCELCGTRFSPHAELEHVRRELETPHRNLIAKLRALDVSEVGGFCGQPPDIVAAVYWGTYVTVREAGKVADLPPKPAGKV